MHPLILALLAGFSCELCLNFGSRAVSLITPDDAQDVIDVRHCMQLGYRGTGVQDL